MTLERARTAVFWALAAWILLSPATVQVFHWDLGWVRGWQMYSNSGVGTCDVRFYVRTEAGDTLLPRLATLHPDEPWYTLQPSARRIGLADVPRVGRQLCMLAKAEDVRASARCGSSNGWRNELRREENLCRPSRGNQR